MASAAVDVAMTLDPALGAELAVLVARRFPDDPYLAFLASGAAAV